MTRPLHLTGALWALVIGVALPASAAAEAEARGRFYASLFGGMAASAGFQGGGPTMDTVGAVGALEAGYFLTPRLSVGGRFQQTIAFGAFGLGLDLFGATFGGVTADYSLVDGGTVAWRVGATAGYAAFSGVALFAFALPAAAGSYESLVVGPRTSLDFRLSHSLDLVTEVSALYVPGGTTTSYTSVGGGQSARVPDFVMAHGGLALRLRL